MLGVQGGPAVMTHDEEGSCQSSWWPFGDTPKACGNLHIDLVEQRCFLEYIFHRRENREGVVLGVRNGFAGFLLSVAKKAPPDRFLLQHCGNRRSPRPVQCVRNGMIDYLLDASDSKEKELYRCLLRERTLPPNLCCP